MHLLPAPTADTNLTYAMAHLAMVGVWTYGIQQKGLKGYLKHFIEPYPVLLPLNILEELVKPITLALRLFGNIFAGGIMLALIAGYSPATSRGRVLPSSTSSGSCSTWLSAASRPSSSPSWWCCTSAWPAPVTVTSTVTSTSTSTTKQATRNDPELAV